MGKIGVYFCAVICCLFVTLQPADSKTLYSLFDLGKIANEHSQTIRIAEDDVYIAQQEKARALSVLIPRLSTYGRMTRYKDADMTLPDTLTTGVSLTQSFTLNGKELIALDVTRKGIESREYQLESVRSQYLLQVAKTYYNILSAQRFFEIAQSDVRRLETHRNAVREKLNVGNVTKTALYRAEAELSKARTELVKAENGVHNAKAALHNLVNIDTDFDLQREEIAAIENYTCTRAEIEEYALVHRPEIKEALKNLEIAEKTIRYEKSSYWPSIALEGGYRETDMEYEIMGRDVKSDTEDLYVSGELVLTLFDGGLRRAQIRQAIADHRKAKNALELQKKEVILDSQTSFLSYTTAKNTLINLADELKASQENFNAVQMQFQYGMADSIDMMDANTLLVSAERRILDAKYTFYFSVLNILYTRGDLVSFLLSEG